MLTLRAVFGGTFDPVHHGHLAAAREMRDALRVDDFRFLPAGDPPHRDDTFASPGHRLRMLELALAGSEGFGIDRRELERDGPSWMSVTLDSLRDEYPDDALALVLGQDALNGLDRWHDWRRLPELAHFVVMTRPGERPDYSESLSRALTGRFVRDPAALRSAPGGLVLPQAVTPRDISSTGVRACVGDPDALRRAVPDAVAAYIEAHRLYRAKASDAGPDL